MIPIGGVKWQAIVDAVDRLLSDLDDVIGIRLSNLLELC